MQSFELVGLPLVLNDLIDTLSVDIIEMWHVCYNTALFDLVCLLIWPIWLKAYVFYQCGELT